MKRNLLTVSLLAIGFTASSQILTHVGNGALVTVTDGALVYNGGGLKVVGNATGTAAVVKNHGDIMIVKGADPAAVTLEAGSDFILVFGKKNDADTGTDKEVYGQLYISGVDQGSISGKLNKQYIADFDHSTIGGHQQMGLPFYQFTLGDLDAAVGSYLNLTNGAFTTSGRWANDSVFRWNNDKSRFDQVVGSATTLMGAPTDYFIVSRRDADGSAKWTPSTDLKIFKGVPVADTSAMTNAVVLKTSDVASFGTDGSGVNYFREKYNTYLNDPFGETKWTGNYGKLMSQFANPFLTNLDLYNLNNMGLPLEDVDGIAYFGENSLDWSANVGTTYTGGATMVIAKTLSGKWQAGDVDKLMIKPLGEVAIKFTRDIEPTVNLNAGRKFPQTPSATTVLNNPTARMSTVSIPADQLVKQVAVVAYDSNNLELGRTYYAVSPSSSTGFATDAGLQASFNGAVLYTKEETADGGVDTNTAEQFYINEANEIDYKGKQISMVVTDPNVKSFKFLVYQGGTVVDALSSGESFYIGNGNTFTKINTNDTMPASASNYNLYYGNPQAKGLDVTVPGATKSHTVIAKNNNDWVIRFADTWKSASVEVYSAAGRLLHSAQSVSTANDYTVPMNSSANGLFIIKTTSDQGEVVVKKIVK